MADLLECLVQVRALAQSPARVDALLARHAEAAWRRRPEPEVWAPLEVLAHLADRELVFAASLLVLLSRDRPLLAAFDGAELARRSRYLEWPLDAAAERFRRRRRDSVEVLSSCSADELERTGRDEARGMITVADLVAIQLAYDTDHLGLIRSRLGDTRCPTPRSA